MSQINNFYNEGELLMKRTLKSKITSSEVAIAPAKGSRFPNWLHACQFNIATYSNHLNAVHQHKTTGLSESNLLGSKVIVNTNLEDRGTSITFNCYYHMTVNILTYFTSC